MSTLHLELWLTLGLALLFLALLLKLSDFPQWHLAPQQARRQSPRPLRSRTPDDCPLLGIRSRTPAIGRPISFWFARRTGP